MRSPVVKPAKPVSIEVLPLTGTVPIHPFHLLKSFQNLNLQKKKSNLQNSKIPILSSFRKLTPFTVHLFVFTNKGQFRRLERLEEFGSFQTKVIAVFAVKVQLRIRLGAGCDLTQSEAARSLTESDREEA